MGEKHDPSSDRTQGIDGQFAFPTLYVSHAHSPHPWETEGNPNAGVFKVAAARLLCSSSVA